MSVALLVSLRLIGSGLCITAELGGLGVVNKNDDEKLLLKAGVPSVVVVVEDRDVLILRCDMIARAAIESKLLCLGG
jgi:hypothetical protein